MPVRSPGRPRASDDTDRREAILRSAAGLFARQGISQTNLRQIARKARLSSGTLHYHFPSKDELVRTLVLDVVRAVGHRTADVLRADDEPPVLVRRLVELVYDAMDADWARFYAGLVVGDEVRAEMPDEFPTWTQALIELVRRWQRQGKARPGDPVLLGVLCHGMLLRVPRARIFGELPPPMRQYAAAVAEACWRVLAP